MLSPNNGRPADLLDIISPQKPSISGKREPEAFDKEKAYKILKVSDPGQRYEKENLDPRRHSNVSYYFNIYYSIINFRKTNFKLVFF